MIKWDEIKQKAKDKYFDAKVWVKLKADQAKDWIREHPDETIVAIGILGAGVKYADKMHKEYRREQKEDWEREHTDRDIWDASTGTWLHIRRPMTTDEKTEYVLRVNSGETRISVLIDMGLI